MSSTHIFVHAEIFAKADKVEELKKLLSDLSASTADEPGTLFYKIIQREDDPTRFIAFEEYHDKAAAEAHNQNKIFLNLVSRVEELCAKPPVIAAGKPI